ncbi:unnamed protein product, partial [Echinostoma caproni]|uniref:Rho-GAP domain-containing protein n=1 Tax=Echinostoma caproni TaxID=27848 RepID=A0A183APF5_9TREM
VTEQYSVKSCVRRSSDSIDRRFCFDVEVENRATPLTLQAQSQDDLAQWLRIMDGQEPQYADRLVSVTDADRTFLSPQSIAFFCRLLEAIEKQDLDTSGIYRISGVKSKISALTCQALSPGGVTLKYLLDCDIHLLTSTVKHFVRHLDEPLMTFELHDDVMAAVKRSPEERLEELRRLLGFLPSRNREVLSILMHHLAKVASHSARNNMTSSNLAIVFAPSLMRSREESVAAIMNTKFSSTAVELMIDNCDTLFPLDSALPHPVLTVNGTKPTPAFIEPVYSTPVMTNPTERPAFRLSTSEADRSLCLVDSPNNPSGKVTVVYRSSESDSMNNNSTSPSSGLLHPNDATSSIGLRRVHSGNTPSGRPLRFNRDVVRRKPAAPPAPNNPPRPPPPVTAPCVPVESSLVPPVSSNDMTELSESKQQKQFSYKATLSKPAFESSQDIGSPRTIAIVNPQVAMEPGLTSPDPSAKIKIYLTDTKSAYLWTGWHRPLLLIGHLFNTVTAWGPECFNGIQYRIQAFGKRRAIEKFS